MPGLDTHETRRKEVPFGGTELLNKVPTKFKGEDDSTKRYDWEVVENFPNSKLDYKIPKYVKTMYNDIISNKETGLFKLDVTHSDGLFNFDDIRRECRKHFTDPKILEICDDAKKFDEFIYWCVMCQKEGYGGPHNSTAHTAYIYGVNYPTNDIYIKKTFLPPRRKLINALKKYITIYSLNRIPCITEHLQEYGIITLYQTDGTETDSIRNIAFEFYKIIKEQAEYLRVIPPRDGRRVYVLGSCKFEK